MKLSIRSLLLPLALVGGLGACAVAPNAPEEEDVRKTGADRPTFEEWARANARQEGDVYYVEGDMGLSRAQAEAYYAAMIGASGALWSYVGQWVTPYGAISKFPEWEQQDITWCIADGFTSSETSRLHSFLNQAMGAWEAVANVRFRLLSISTTACETSTTAKLRVTVMPETTPKAAAACDAPESGRRLTIKKSVVMGDSTFMMAVLQHELGHGLGFGHEHDRPMDTTPCSLMQGCGAYLTPRDTSSVMHYADELLGYTGGDGGGGLNYITQWDLEGSQKVYGAPTNVVNSQNGVVYARKLVDGDFYRRESSGAWTKIGGPGRAFFSVGNTIYGQSPQLGRANRYVSGQTWQTIPGGDNGQLFRCVNTICATSPTTQQIARYSGGSWAFIGGPGLRFAATETQLFGLTPHQEGVAVWSGNGSAWWWAGANAFSRELAGGGLRMVRILTAYQGPTDVLASVQQLDGSAWSTIGSFNRLRQVHASGPNVFALNGPGAVYTYDGVSWTNVSDPSVVVNRLYGSDGLVFGTTADGTVFQYDAGHWRSLGKP